MRTFNHCGPSLLLLVLIVAPAFARGDELNNQLKRQYANKVFVLRNFYPGSDLKYDSSGKLSRSAQPGDWTSDGIVQIQSVHFSHQRLKIRASRLVAFTQTKDELSLFQSADGVGIEVDMGADAVTPEKITETWSSIFLNSQDRFADLVPEFWKACVQLALSHVEDKTYSGCHFSEQLVSLFGAASYTSDEAAKILARDSSVESLVGSNAQGRLHRIGKDISPPRQLSNQEPEFSECARRNHLQGTLTLTLVIDETGSPKDIRLARPLGCGFDVNAVKRVSQWKFNPAAKNGQPVPVEVAIEVSFHLQ